ncbi:hypothetical protein VN97_g12080 [Penicillium thymicola]|uniref:Uncharacterized protein n=1 Tax=Penicillium thymicola TaxID=293382 RepID=A0AAI9T6U2_PENTH|nr:hypothetical protein VN97_g12080 [Penicillium thymicola]
MAEIPAILLVESSVQQIDHVRRQTLSEKVTILEYDCASVDDFVARLQPGGLYSNICAIIRTGWLKAGPYASHRLFASEVIPHFPSSLKLICCSGHGYDAADIDALTSGESGSVTRQMHARRQSQTLDSCWCWRHSAI